MKRSTDDERFDHNFTHVKVNLGCRWRVREYRRKVEIHQSERVGEGDRPKECEVKVRSAVGRLF